MKELAQLFGAMVAMGFETKNFAVAGGALRDRMLDPGACPKDIDVVIVQHGRGQFDQDLLPEGWLVGDEFGSEYGDEVVSEDFDKRIDHVTKLQYVGGEFSIEPIQVDLIFALDRFYTTYGFVREFDFNINQWILPSEVVIRQQGERRPPMFIGDNRGVLAETRGTEVHPHRRLRMIELARRVGWDVSNFEGELP